MFCATNFLSGEGGTRATSCICNSPLSSSDWLASVTCFLSSSPHDKQSPLRPDGTMKIQGETDTLFTALRESAKRESVSAIEKLILDAPHRELSRINVLVFA